MFIVCTIPFLTATFGLLFVFYRFFHPWASEGVSVGFEPGRKLHDDMMQDVYELGENSDLQHQNSGEERGVYGKSTLTLFFRL